MMSSLYIGASGMVTHGEGMSVVTNNISNVNTVGYKQQSMLFSDMVSQLMPARSNNITNLSQVGMGARVGATRTLFTQGGFETGSDATDIAINGLGFFGVSHNGETQYTRAGNFRFTKEGDLVDPGGWNVMGRPIVKGTEAGSASPIHIDFSSSTGVGRMAPEATSRITAISQLGGIADNNENTANPFFAMAASWDGTSQTPLGANQFSYREPVQFFDSNGLLRDAFVYYDLAGTQNGQKSMEYLVAMAPSDDASGLAGTQAAGLLMGGTLTFSSTGQLQNVTAFTPPGSGNPQDLSGWTPAALIDGAPAFTVAPTGAKAQTIGLNMGLTLSGSSSSGLASAADAASNPSAIYSPNTGAKRQPAASTAYGSTAGSVMQQRDGYSEGTLYNLSVTDDGILRGRYSNGETMDLYRIPLYRFTSQDGLRHEGSNRYSASLESGPAEEGIPGEENFGTLKEYALEQSNVDYAREFSTMIITQRGFQVNSKVVTTSDQMLQKALELKR